jgi:hypothetical protein
MALALLLLAGCSLIQPAAEPVTPTVFEIGLSQMADGDFPAAEQAFRQSASRCESGSHGRRALLFLSFLALDPRNPATNPDSSALMAARFLNLPGNTREETLEAEALYVTALDYGADPELRVDPTNPGFAVRFGDCDQPFPPRDNRPLPTLEGSTLGRLQSLDAEKGALVQENQQLRYSVGRFRRASDSLQAQVDTLAAELERIRQLIRLPDTAVTRKPDTANARKPDTSTAMQPDAGRGRVSNTTLSLILGIDRARPPVRQ